MGTSPNPGVSGVRCTMRAFVIVLLAAVAVNADAEAEAYTVGQVAHGLTNGGIVTGVDHGHGVVSGYGAIGNRAISHVAGVYNAHPVNTVYNTVPVHNVAGVYNTPAVYPNVYTGLNHLYGKREAEPEAEAEPFHHTGLGHVAGVYNSYPVSTVAGVTHAVPTVYNTAVPTVHAGVYNTHHAIATPVVRRVEVSSVYPNYYSGLNHVYGKREAEAEPYVYSNLYNHAGYAGVYNSVPAVAGVRHAGVYNYPAVARVHNAGVYWG